MAIPASKWFRAGGKSGDGRRLDAVGGQSRASRWHDQRDAPGGGGPGEHPARGQGAAGAPRVTARPSRRALVEKPPACSPHTSTSTTSSHRSANSSSTLARDSPTPAIVVSSFVEPSAPYHLVQCRPRLPPPRCPDKCISLLWLMAAASHFFALHPVLAVHLCEMRIIEKPTNNMPRPAS